MLAWFAGDTKLGGVAHTSEGHLAGPAPSGVLGREESDEI